MSTSPLLLWKSDDGSIEWQESGVELVHPHRNLLHLSGPETYHELVHAETKKLGMQKTLLSHSECGD